MTQGRKQMRYMDFQKCTFNCMWMCPDKSKEAGEGFGGA